MSTWITWALFTFCVLMWALAVYVAWKCWRMTRRDLNELRASLDAKREPE